MLKIGVAMLEGDRYKTKTLLEVGNCSLGESYEADDVTECCTGHKQNQ